MVRVTPAWPREVLVKMPPTTPPWVSAAMDRATKVGYIWFCTVYTVHLHCTVTGSVHLQYTILDPATQVGPTENWDSTAGQMD